MRNLGIYVHIPFCKRKCNYCDFISFADKAEYENQYVKSVIKEIENRWDRKNNYVYKVDTIYIGGGTPSYISGESIEKIINKIKEVFIVSHKCEITIEINPGLIDEEKLRTFLKIGINRISIGCQSMNDEILKMLGRIHTKNDFLESYNLVKKVGFDNINVDLMIGLPNQSLEDVENSLAEIIDLNPNHVSVYSLIVEDGTNIEKQISLGSLVLPEEELERDMYHKVKKMLERNGYCHYEISNFAKKGFESKHNMNCWNQDEYIGFGLASHSYFDDKRFSNVENLDEYISNIENGNFEKNTTVHEIQSSESKKKEYMLLGLRKIEGVSISKFEQKFRINPLFYFRFEISKLEEEDLLEVDLDNIKLTDKGLDLANVVWEEFV